MSSFAETVSVWRAAAPSFDASTRVVSAIAEATPAMPMAPATSVATAAFNRFVVFTFCFLSSSWAAPRGVAEAPRIPMRDLSMRPGPTAIVGRPAETHGLPADRAGRPEGQRQGHGVHRREHERHAPRGRGPRRHRLDRARHEAPPHGRDRTPWHAPTRKTSAQSAGGASLHRAWKEPSAPNAPPARS